MNSNINIRFFKSHLLKFTLLSVLLIGSYSFASTDQAQNLLQGTYTVPVFDESLRQHAISNIKVRALQEQSSDKVYQISYKLPRVLTGVNENIEVNCNTQELRPYSTQKTKCECIQHETEVACVLNYQNLSGSLVLANEFIETLDTTALTKEKFKKIAGVFSCDPVGIVHFDFANQSINPLSSLKAELIDKVLATSRCAL